MPAKEWLWPSDDDDNDDENGIYDKPFAVELPCLVFGNIWSQQLHKNGFTICAFKDAWSRRTAFELTVAGQVPISYSNALRLSSITFVSDDE